MHVSIVPQSPEFFTSGDMNRFMRFVLERGAEKVRLLLPRFVGHSIRENGGPVAAGEEASLFSCVSPRYHEHIYVHTPGTPLGERNICTAKQVFCHVMSNGWVAPCPYFPLVFGDATREPIVDVFERIQSHPLVRLGGDYCPMRNEEYINTHVRPLGLERPFFPITMTNQVDLGAPCGSACPGCSYGARSGIRPFEEISRDLGGIAPEYTRVEFYGGDALRRDDLFSLLDRMPRCREIVLWTSCRSSVDASFMQRLRSYPIAAVKVHAGEPAEALARARSLSSWGFPVQLYVPLDRVEQARSIFGADLERLGIERLYTFTNTEDASRSLVNAVACFGKGLERVRMLWAYREQPAPSVVQRT
jgi:hypothetical protein